MPSSIVERIQRLRADVLEIAKDSIDDNVRVFRGLSDVAVRLTDLIDNGELPVTATQPLSALAETRTPPLAEKARHESESVIQPPNSRQIIPIYHNYKGVIYEAELDVSLISPYQQTKCVWFRGELMRPSQAAMRISVSSANGWLFWRYRDNGRELSINAIREKIRRSDE